jgi:hypothetical protein
VLSVIRFLNSFLTKERGCIQTKEQKLFIVANVVFVKAFARAITKTFFWCIKLRRLAAAKLRTDVFNRFNGGEFVCSALVQLFLAGGGSARDGRILQQDS